MVEKSRILRFHFFGIVFSCLFASLPAAALVTADLSVVESGTDCIQGAVVAGCTLELDLELRNFGIPGVRGPLPLIGAAISIVAQNGAGERLDISQVATLQTFETSKQLFIRLSAFDFGLPNFGGFLSSGNLFDPTEVLRAVLAVQVPPVNLSVAGSGTGEEDSLTTGGVPIGGNGGQLRMVFILTGLEGNYTLSADLMPGDGIFVDQRAPFDREQPIENLRAPIDISAVPEPGTALLLGLGLVLLSRSSRKSP